MARIIYFSVVLAALTHSAYSLRDNLEYQLDVLGENNLERIDKEVIDPGVTEFKPINEAVINVVKYGDTTIWRKSGKKQFLLLRLFKVVGLDSFMNLFYLDGKKVYSMVFVKTGDKWENTGKFHVKNPEDLTGAPLPKLKSAFSKDASDTSSESSLDFSSEEDDSNVDLDLGGYVGDMAKIKEYYTMEVFTTEYRPFGGKMVRSVTDKYQTIWKSEPGKKQLRQMFRYDKMGYVPLLHICTGTDLFNSGDSFYEKLKDEWMPVKMDQFIKRLKYSTTAEVDPQFDQPPEVYEEQPHLRPFAGGNNLANKSTWSEYPYSLPYSSTGAKSLDSTSGTQNSGLDSLKTSVQEVPISVKEASQPETGSQVVPLSQSSGSYPEENEATTIGLDDDIIDLTNGYEMVSLPSPPVSLSSNPEMKTKR